MLAAMEKNIKQAEEDAKKKLRRDYLGQPWLGNSPLFVVPKALDHVIRQWRLALGALPSETNPLPTPLGPCTGRFTSQFGAHCSHELLMRKKKKEEEGPLKLFRDDFDPY
ncbi:hypothetical protein V8F33_010132 [Rhypophila sp. PSN 637]